MTFYEWWQVIKPAECDELKEYFQEAYQIGFNHGYKSGVAAFHEAVLFEREACAALAEDTASGRDAEAIADAIRMRSNAKVRGGGTPSAGLPG